jgi:hypothetical protein
MAKSKISSDDSQADVKMGLMKDKEKDKFRR